MEEDRAEGVDVAGPGRRSTIEDLGGEVGADTRYRIGCRQRAQQGVSETEAGDRRVAVVAEVDETGVEKTVGEPVPGILDGFAGLEVVSAANGRVRLRVDEGTDLEPLVKAASAMGRVREFSYTPPNLSEVFREVVGR